MKLMVISTVLLLFASSSMAINLKEFQQVVQQGQATAIHKSFEEVVESGSPELIMRARATLMRTLPDTPAREAILTQALEKTLTITPSTPKDTMWVANAYYIKAQILIQPEEKFNHLKQATLLGHDKAPAEMALLIAEKQPTKARDLLTLSLMRGNYNAAVMYAKLDGSPAKKAELTRILQDMASKGDTRAKRTLNEMRSEPL